MSADPRGAESTAASRRWYLEASGRRAGPFAWTVLVELAQAGALGADDRIWRMGLESWSRAADLADLAPLIREPAPARAFVSSDTSESVTGGNWPLRRGSRLLAGLCALLLLAVVIGTALNIHRLAGYLVDRISTPGSSPSGQSLAAYASLASAFEGRYPFLTELRRVEPFRFDRLDSALQLGFRRGAARAELNALVAQTADHVEHGRLSEVDDGSALRLLVELRTAARGFQSSEPAQCVAILSPHSAAAPIRSAAALAAISPALVGLLDTPARLAGAARSGGNAQQDAPGVSPKLACDRLLLMYDTAVASSPDTGAAFIRALQGDAGH